MSSLTIVVTGTYLSPFSASDTYNVLHGGYLLDPMASPLSFFYPTSVFGGEIATIFTEYLSGGQTELAYDDLPENELILGGHYVFCNSDVIFDLSEFDQTESKIIKLIFNPDNGLESQTFDSKIQNSQLYYPVLSSIQSTYYPSEEFYTLFYPKFEIYYEDGNVVNITIPLTSVQCGIFDSYKDKTIVEVVPFYKKSSNVLLFVNDNLQDDLILTNISTSLKFELEETVQQLPFATEAPLAIPLGIGLLQQISTTTIQIPIPPVNVNPVIPPQPSPTPTPTPVYDKGIVTLVDKIQMQELGGGEDIYPLTDKGIVSFEDYQIVSFANQDMYPFITGFNPNIVTFVNGGNVIRFGGSELETFL
jgi:hypothetical protein